MSPAMSPVAAVSSAPAVTVRENTIASTRNRDKNLCFFILYASFTILELSRPDDSFSIAHPTKKDRAILTALC